MQELRLVCGSPEQTAALGRILGEALAGPMVIFLTGALGAGKTCLAGGLARGLGVPTDEPVTSPTFTLMNHYRGRLDLFHFDLYRLEYAADLEELGMDEVLGAGGVAVIEWADRIPALPAADLEIHLRYCGEACREADIRARGEEGEAILSRLDRVWREKGEDLD